MACCMFGFTRQAISYKILADIKFKFLMKELWWTEFMKLENKNLYKM